MLGTYLTEHLHFVSVTSPADYTHAFQWIETLVTVAVERGIVNARLAARILIEGCPLKVPEVWLRITPIIRRSTRTFTPAERCRLTRRILQQFANKVEDRSLQLAAARAGMLVDFLLNGQEALPTFRNLMILAPCLGEGRPPPGLSL